MKRLDDVARDVVKFFESQRIVYALMGGIAVRIHAIPRPTFDIDFTIAIPRGDLPRLYEHLEKQGYAVPEAQLTGWIESVRGLPLIKCQAWVGAGAIDIDVFLAETPYQNELLKRRQYHRSEGLDAWFVSAEDLILLKLLAGRPKDKVDIADVLFVQGKLDEEYLRKWANSLHISAELENALAERDAGDS